MTNQFITVSLILDALKNERGPTGGSRIEEAKKFLEWEEGFHVAPKNDRSAVHKIKRISPLTAGMTYQAQVTLESLEDPEESRSLRGATLQSGWVFVSRGDSSAPEMLKKTTKPMTIATDTIRTFSPRTRSRPGSRIVLKDGTSYPVVEDHDEINARIYVK